MFFSKIFAKVFPQKTRIAWTTHINPDGSEGGRVAKGAVVGHNVTIEKLALVFSGATVPDGTILMHGDYYTEDGLLNFK